MHQIPFGGRASLRLAGRAYSAPPDSRAGFKGSYFKGMGKKRGGRERGRKGRRRKGMTGLTPPLPEYKSCRLRAWKRFCYAYSI